MPNLRITSADDIQNNSGGEVFTLQEPTTAQSKFPIKPMMRSIGVGTSDLDFSAKPRVTSTVVIQKNSFNCTGIDFGVGGVYVKDFDKSEISFKKGELFVGELVD